jgi:hypothetical protein
MKRILNYRNTLLLAWVLVLTFSNAMGLAEGKIFPVIGAFTVASIEEGIVTGSFLKLRSCDFEGVDWYYTDGNKRIPAALTFIEKAKIRPIGRQMYGPWKVNIPSTEIEERSYVIIRHNCHPFFDTLTKVYP